jgi:hypothetical protein
MRNVKISTVKVGGGDLSPREKKNGRRDGGMKIFH